MNSRKIALCGLLTALALLMGYVEMLIPLPVALPGIKLGLANAVILIALYILGTKTAFFLSLVRVVLSGLLFAGFAGMLYSLSGAMLSFLVMAVLKKTDKMSIIGVSMAGGIFHNVGQIVVAALVVENVKMAYYLPFLLVSGIVTGLFIGLVAKVCLPHLPRI